MSFKDKVSSGGGLDAAPGFMIRVPGAKHRTSLASWDHETRIRIFPVPNPSGDGWLPIRCSAENDDFSDAVTVEPVCKKLGVHEQFTYITHIPGSDSEDPTTKFTKALLSTAKDNPHDLPREWCGWTKGGASRAAKITKVQNHIFFQCAMTMIKGEPCVNPQTQQPSPRFPALFMGTVSLLMAFQKAGNTLNPDYNGPAPDTITDPTGPSRVELDQIFANMFKMGDWCSPEHGRVMRIFQVPRTAENNAHYGIELVEEMPLGGMESKVRELWTPWKQLLRYHTAEEQIGYLLRGFPGEAVDFALGRTEYAPLLPAHVRGSWQRMQNGEAAPALPAAAAAQVNQQTPAPAPVQQATPAPAPEFSTPANTTSAWGDGSGEPQPYDAVAAGDADELPPEKPTGPAVPSTPAGTQQTTESAGQLPAVSGVDPAALAAALGMLQKGQNSQG